MDYYYHGLIQLYGIIAGIVLERPARAVCDYSTGRLRYSARSHIPPGVSGLLSLIGRLYFAIFFHSFFIFFLFFSSVFRARSTRQPPRRSITSARGPRRPSFALVPWFARASAVLLLFLAASNCPRAFIKININYIATVPASHNLSSPRPPAPGIMSRRRRVQKKKMC